MSQDDHIKAHLHALVNISKEGLWEYESSHFEWLASMYYRLGDQRNLKRWGEKARDAYKASDNGSGILRWELVLNGGPLIEPSYD